MTIGYVCSARLCMMLVRLYIGSEEPMISKKNLFVLLSYIYFNKLKISLTLLSFYSLETDFDPAEWGAKVDDRFYNNRAFQEEEPPEKDVPEKEQSQESVNEEETPVTVLESSEEDKEKMEFAAIKIQAAFRGHLARQEVKKMKLVERAKEETA
ncbi:sperm surface protein Sp17 isoform 1-T1 [Trichechus inunguis]|uniref:Sperm surface protein Sp17 isoform X1 n=1 Tax=Trichechus manatus latirostris TaxID=127582 RepID=A0A2Y9R2P6_TRIMA|nr:sperm surface protein Sp17 isoform X1 [Trichechus manatus latirostris]